MKHLLTMALITIAGLANAQTATDSANAKKLPEGTIVTVSLLQELSSKTNMAGEIIEFETSEPVIVGDRVLVPKGAHVTGKITESEKAKGMGKAGVLNFTIDYLTLPSGKIVKLTSEIKTKGDNKTGTAVAEAVLLTPLFLLKKGKNKKFEKGQQFKVFVAQDYDL